MAVPKGRTIQQGGAALPLLVQERVFPKRQHQQPDVFYGSIWRRQVLSATAQLACLSAKLKGSRRNIPRPRVALARDAELRIISADNRVAIPHDATSEKRTRAK